MDSIFIRIGRASVALPAWLFLLLLSMVGNGTTMPWPARAAGAVEAKAVAPAPQRPPRTVSPPGAAAISARDSVAGRGQAPRAAASVTASMADEVVPDAEGDGAAAPGDTVRYRIEIANSGPGDATDASFEATIDPHTTLVPGSPDVSPLAFDDAWVAVGNTLLRVGPAPGPEPEVWHPGSLLANDVEFLGDGFTLVASDTASSAGGAVAIDASGGFTYLPPAGFSGVDTFQYTIGDARGLKSTGTVTITVAGRVWYVKAGIPPGGDGRSGAPLDQLGPLNAATGSGDLDAPGDVIFLYESTTAYEGIVLEPGQRLIGQGVDLVVDPGTGPVTLVTATFRAFVVPPAGVTGIALSADNTVRGVHVIATDAHGIAGAAVGALTIDHTGIETMAPALDRAGLALANGALAVDVDSLVVTSGGRGITLSDCSGSTTLTGIQVHARTYGLSATNAGTLTVTGNQNTIATVSATPAAGAALEVSNTTIGVGGLRFRSLTAARLSRGLDLENTGALGGLIVTGVGIDSSGGRLDQCTTGIRLQSVRSATISSMAITGSTDRHIAATDLTNGLRLTRVLMSGAPNGVALQNVLGSSLLNSCAITGSAAAHLSIVLDTATEPAPGTPDLLTLSGCTVSGASGGDGVGIVGSGDANLRVIVSGGSFSDNGDEGIDVQAADSGRVDVRVSGAALTGNGGDAMDVVTSSSADAIVDVRNLIGISSAGTALSLATRDSSTLQATVENVGITGASSGAGIACEQTGDGSLIARIAGCTTSGTFGPGIVGETSGGTGLMSLTLAGNQVGAPVGGGAIQGIFVRSPGADGGANAVCLEMSGNSSAGSGSGAGYALWQGPGTSFQLQNFTGDGTSNPDVFHWVNDVKSNTGTVSVSWASGFGTSAGCETPDPLPGVPAVAIEVDAPAPLRASAAPIALSAGPGVPSAPGARLAAFSAYAPRDVRTTAGWSVAIGTLPAGRTLTMVFDVVVDGLPSPAPSEVAAQGTFSAAGIADVLTDDPDLPGSSDPTRTPLALARDLGVVAVLAPVSGCARTSAEAVSIAIHNFTTVARGGFDVSYTVTGPLAAGPVVQNVGAFEVEPGGTATFTFAATADLSAPGTYTITARTLLADDTDPTNDSTAAAIASWPVPQASAGADRSVASGSSTVLGGSPTASAGTAPYTYAWTPTAGLDDPAAANPTATVSAPITYAVTVTDAHGCQAVDSVAVAVTSGGSIEVLLAGSANDAEESPSGSVNLTSVDLDLVDDAGSLVTVGLRFANVGIPAGATITQAWVQFTAKGASSGASALTLRGQAADSAAIFTTASQNVSARPRTSASVAWAPPAWTTNLAGPAQRTTELKTVIQQIVGRPGWKSGNALALFVTGTGSRIAFSWDGGAAQAPRLHVDYSLAVAPNAAPVVDAGPAQSVAYPGSVSLDGTVSDDHLPNPPNAVTTLWEKASGPGAVTFGNPNAVDTQASFSATGTYVLRLTASDGALSGSDSVTIDVLGPASADTPALAFTRARVVPHPVRGAANLELEIARAGLVRLDVFDAQGRRLGALIDGVRLAAGRHTVPLGRRWSSGLYFYRLAAPDRVLTGRFLVLD